MNTTNDEIRTTLIDTHRDLTDMVNHLKTLKEISIDTEFDSFNKQYGIHLQLIQVFDGTTCFLIDPLAIKNLSELWSVFENTAICKVVYSGANDVDILKRFGCNTKNLFDIQIATELCKRLEKSLSALLEKEFSVVLDKSTQAAGWGNRPLSSKQLIYAGNDVIYLLHLKEMLLHEIQQNDLSNILLEKNLNLELSASKDYFPKLSGKQHKVFNKYMQQKLLQLKILIDIYAEELNLPPFKIVQDSYLEEIVKDVKLFLNQPFPEKGFHKKILQNRKFKSQFLEIIRSIDPDAGWENKRRR